MNYRPSLIQKVLNMGVRYYRSHPQKHCVQTRLLKTVSRLPDCIGEEVFFTWTEIHEKQSHLSRRPLRCVATSEN